MLTKARRRVHNLKRLTEVAVETLLRNTDAEGQNNLLDAVVAISDANIDDDQREAAETTFRR